MVDITIQLKQVKQTLFQKLSLLVGQPHEGAEDLDMYRLVSEHILDHLHDRRGIAMFGVVGCGKTVLMTAALATMKTLLTGIYDHPPCRRISAGELNDMFGNVPSPEAYRELLSNHLHLYIDDIGTEDPYKMYGAEKPYHLKGLIYAAEDMVDAAAIHFSTNMNSEQFSARYGARVLDRVLGMCQLMQYKSKKSKRHER